MAHLTETFIYKSTYIIKWGRLGSPSNPPVIMCHGTPFSSVVWLPFAEALQQDYCIYLWDLAGFGASQELTPEHMNNFDGIDVGFSLQGALFAALCGLWGFSSDQQDNLPHVIAHDIGGATALRAHLLHGVKFASLCLLDIVTMRPWGSPFVWLIKEQRSAFDQLAPHMFEGLLHSYIAGASWRGLRKDMQDLLAGNWLSRGEEGKKAFFKQIAHQKLADTDEIEPLLDGVMEDAKDEPSGKKVKIIWAENDNWIPIENGEKLRDAVAASEFVRVPDAGHLVMVDQPERVMFEICTWLTKVTR